MKVTIFLKICLPQLKQNVNLGSWVFNHSNYYITMNLFLLVETESYIHDLNISVHETNHKRKECD